MMNLPESLDTFCLTVEFEQNTTSPHVLFESIANMILELQSIDKSLTKCIDSNIEPMFVLEEVEKGSIKIWLQQLLKNIPDEAIAEMDAKKIIGAFLVKGKYKVLDKMEEPKYLEEPKNIDALCNELTEMAKETAILMPATFSNVDAPRLLGSMNKISSIAKKLPEGSKFIYSANDVHTEINKGFLIPDEMIEHIAEHDCISNKNTMIIKVRQPDYLGNAQWVFKYNNRRIMCAFEDEEWLEYFHSRRVNIGPGDSLRVTMDVRVGYDSHHEVISEKYTIIKVLEVIPYDNGSEQINLQTN